MKGKIELNFILKFLLSFNFMFLFQKVFSSHQQIFSQITKAEGIYHDQIDALIARRPIWWPNLFMTWLRNKYI